MKQIKIHRLSWIRDKVRLEDTILEVGCAENPTWKGRPNKVTTLDKDIRPPDHEHPCSPDIRAYAESLPCQENSYDIVVLGEVLEHVPDPQIVLKEAVRVASKKVIVTVPWEHAWPPEITPFQNPGHVRYYEPETLTQELAKVGLPFSIEEIRHGGWAWFGAEVQCKVRKMLNIGSFTVMLPPPWVNLDIIDLSDYAKKKGLNFQRVDVTQGLPFGDKSIDFINCSHLIEHLTVGAGRAFLKECKRVLKSDGTIRIGMPDTNKIIDAYKRGEMDRFNDIQPEEYRQSPSHADKFWRLLVPGHKTCYDFNAIRQALEFTGFISIRQVEYNEELDMFPSVSLYVESGFAPRIEKERETETPDRFTWTRNKIEELTRGKPNAQVVDIGIAECPITREVPNCTWVDIKSYEEVIELMKTTPYTIYARDEHGIFKTVAWAQRPLTEFIPREKFVQANAENLPFENKQFDVAVCTELLEHAQNPAAVLREIKRVARQAIITTPNEYGWAPEYKPFEAKGHIRFYTEETLRQHLAEADIDNYEFKRLVYEGWSIFSVVTKEDNMGRFDANFYDGEYFEGFSKSGYSGKYAEIEGPKQPLIANFLKTCFRGPILDVGCAYGFLCAALQDAGVDAIGIDISEYSIANAVSRVKGKLSACDVTLGTPFKDREFPTVVAFQTMEHIPIDRIPLVVKEMCRICEEYIAIEVPTWYDDKTPDRSDTFDKSHVSFYSASFWVDQFYAEGFFLDINLSHKLKGTDSSRLVFYRGDNVPARLKDDFKVTRLDTETEVKELWDDHYGIPKGYESPQPTQVKVAEDKLKILVISSTVFPVPLKGYGGLEQLAYAWSCEFAKQGHQVSIVAPEGSVLPGGIELIPTGLREDEGQAYLRYKDRLLAGEWDCAQDNSWLWYTVVAQIEAGDRQLPVIHIYHSDPDFLPNPPPIKNPCLVGLSKDHAKRINEKWQFEVRHNYNGIPLDFYTFKPEVQRNGRYLWCARYTPEKMPLETIKLARKCGVPLDLYGNTSIIRNQDYLKQCIAECDDKDVVFHSEVPREETVRLYQSHKALIHLVAYVEAFGLVPVEAMACGMPVIANRRGALPELVEDEFSGFVVDTIEQAEEIIRSGKVDIIKSEDCRKSAEMFSIEASAKGYLKLFREVVAGRVW